MEYKIYTDGSAKKGRKGGWAFAVIQNEECIYHDSHSVEDTTNNRMELQAIIEAVKYASHKNILSNCEFYADSKYVVDGYNDWSFNWLKNSWKTASNKPVLNDDLWKKLLSFDRFKIQWVRAHVGNEFNELADSLAQKAADKL